jgi:hypothetical protein
MSKKGLILLAVIAILFAQNLLAQTIEPSSTEIAFMTKQIVADNPKFSNPNLVYPGDTVLVIDDASGIVTYTVGKWSPRSENGCLWQIAATHLRIQMAREIYDQPKTQPIKEMATLAQNRPAKTPIATQKIACQNEQRKENRLRTLQHVLFLLMAAACLIIVYSGFKLLTWPKQEPVIEGGLSDNLALAVNLISREYQRLSGGECLLFRANRGKLVRRFGNKNAVVHMVFANGIHKTELIDGDATYSMEYTNGDTYYFRASCGNLYIADRGGTFYFPEGWGFDSETSYNRPDNEINQEAKRLLIQEQEEMKGRR